MLRTLVRTAVAWRSTRSVTIKAPRSRLCRLRLVKTYSMTLGSGKEMTQNFVAAFDSIAIDIISPCCSLISWEVGRVAASPLMEGIIVEIPFSLASASIAWIRLVLTVHASECVRGRGSTIGLPAACKRVRYIESDLLGPFDRMIVV